MIPYNNEGTTVNELPASMVFGRALSRGPAGSPDPDHPTTPPLAPGGGVVSLWLQPRRPIRRC